MYRWFPQHLNLFKNPYAQEYEALKDGFDTSKERWLIYFAIVPGRA
jgi:hypothetical protein